MNHRNNFLFVPNSIKLNGWFVQRQPPEVFYKKGVLRNFAKFTGKHLCQSLFFNKIVGSDFAKFLRTPFLWNTFGRLLLPWISKQFLREYCSWSSPFSFRFFTSTSIWKISMNSSIYFLSITSSSNLDVKNSTEDVNDAHMEELVLFWIRYKNSLKYKVGCFWRLSYVYTVN